MEASKVLYLQQVFNPIQNFGGATPIPPHSPKTQVFVCPPEAIPMHYFIGACDVVCCQVDSV